jgi:hypothetical protein
MFPGLPRRLQNLPFVKRRLPHSFLTEALRRVGKPTTSFIEVDVFVN